MLVSACNAAPALLDRPPAVIAPPAVDSTVRLDMGVPEGRTAEVRILPPVTVGAKAARNLLVVNTVHRWVPDDIALYEVVLKIRDADGNFQDIGSGAVVTLPAKGPSPKTKAVFNNLSQGAYYRAYVTAKGNIGGTAAEKVLNTTPATTDFDFTSTQDVVSQITQPVAVQLDGTPFSGKGTVIIGPADAGSYINPVKGVVGKAAGDISVPTGPTNPSQLEPISETGLEAGSIGVLSTGEAWISNGFKLTKLSMEGEILGTVSFPGVCAHIMVDPDDNLWVSNNGGYPNYTGGNMVKLDADGNVLATYSAGNSPTGSEMDADGNVWVANRQDGKVVKLNGAGSIIGMYSAAPDGQGPTGLAIDNDGNVWVSGYDSGKVSKLSSSGELLGAFTTGAFSYGVDVDANNDVWVSSLNSDHIMKFSNAGVPYTTIPLGTSEDANPAQCEVDQNGNVWVILNGNDHFLYVIKPNGEILRQETLPTVLNGMKIDRAHRIVWITTVFESKIFRFSY
jgi:streptogramin lyase